MAISATLAVSALVTLIARGAHSKWPILITFLLLRSISGFALLGISHGPYRQYFYTYWTFAGLQYLCQFGVLFEVCRDVLSSFPSIPQNFPKTMASIVAVTALLSIWIASQTQGTFNAKMVAIAVGMQRTALMAWCASFAICAVCTSWLGLAWKRDTILIGSGTAAMNAAGMVAAFLYGLMTIRHSIVVDNISTLIDISVLLLWLVSLKPAMHIRTNDLPDPESIESLKAIAQSTLGASKK